MDYDDEECIKHHTQAFNAWWDTYMRKQQDKTELAKSIALDAWLAATDKASEAE